MGKGGAKKERGDGGEREEVAGSERSGEGRKREREEEGGGRQGPFYLASKGTLVASHFDKLPTSFEKRSKARMTRAPCWNDHFISLPSVPASLVCCEHTWRQSFTKQTKEEAVWWPQGFRRSQDGQVNVLSHCGRLSVVGGALGWGFQVLKEMFRYLISIPRR